MIYDTVKNSGLYYGISKKLAEGLKFIHDYDISKFDNEPARRELSDGLFVLFQNNKTKDESPLRFEAHHKYIDIQYLVAGAEGMTAIEKTGLTPSEAYNQEKDIEFYTESVCSARFTLTAGCFAVFFPNDAHKPAIKTTAETSKKIVVKVPV